MKKYLPDVSSLISGWWVIILGLFFMRGTTISIDLGGEMVSPITINLSMLLPMLDAWICWTLIWMGIDVAFFKEKATAFILTPVINVLLKPILVGVFGEDRINRWSTSLIGLANKQSSADRENTAAVTKGIDNVT